MSTEIVLPSGAKLSITLSPFDDAMALQEAIGEAMGDVQLPQNLVESEFSIAGVLQDPEFLSLLANKIKSVMLSKTVRAAVFKCFERVTYDSLKLTRAMFYDPAFTEPLIRDYYVICWEVIKANCLPFFDSLISRLKTNVTTTASIHGSK
jgi:hypothetical protein